MSDYIKYMYREYLEGRTRIKKVNEDQPLFPNTGAGLLMANPHSECNRILRGSRPGATYDDACEDMHHWRHHGRLQPS